MIKVVHKADLALLRKHNISPLITDYICEYFHYITKETEVEDFSEIGAIYFIESMDDERKHSLMGLTSPLKNSLYEFTQLLTLKNLKGNKKLLHSCFVISDSYAISVFAEKGTLSTDTEKYLLSDSVCKEVTINRKEELI